MNDDVSDIPAPVADFRQRRDTIRNELGGAARVKSMHDRGERTIRDHIDGFLDTDSFVEVGTFSRSENPADKDSTPGDGKIGGHGAVNGSLGGGSSMFCGR